MPTQTDALQGYLDAIQEKTGKTPAHFAKLARGKGFTKMGEYIKWLKAEHGLGHGYAMAIAGVILKSDQIRASPEDKLDALFSKTKAHWRAPADLLIAAAKKFGADVEVVPNLTYVNLNRGDAKFAILQPSSGKRLDVGLKLKGTAAKGRFAAAGAWNEMVTHRVSLSDAAEADAELLTWLRRAYDAAAS